MKARSNYKIHFLTIFGIAMVSLSSTFLRNPGIPIPWEGIYFSAMLSLIDYADSEIYFLYDLLRSPVYYIIDSFFINIKLFIVATYALPFISSILLYFLLFRFCKNIMMSFWLTILSIPLIFGIIMLIIGETGLIDYTYPDKLASYPGGLIATPFPLSYRTGWCETIFHVRSFFTIFYLMCIYLFIQKRYLHLLIPLLAMFFVHPNNALSAFSIFLLSVGYLIYKKEVDFKYLLLLLVIFIIGITPNLVKLSNISMQGYDTIDNFFWYINTIKDEGDDYSALYLLIYRSKLAIVYLFLPFFVVSIYIIKNKHYYKNNHCFQNILRLKAFSRISILEKLFKSKQSANKVDADPNSHLIFFTILPPIIFLAMLIVEYTSVLFRFGALMPVIITAQIGGKILEMSFFPMLFLISDCAKNYFSNNTYKSIYLSFVPIILIIVSGVYFTDNNIYKLKLYQSLLESKEDMPYIKLLGLRISSHNKYNPGFEKSRFNRSIYSFDSLYINKYNLFQINDIDKEVEKYLINDNQYYSDYNSYDVLKNIIGAIEQNVPTNQGLIVPPYTGMWRSCLVYYPVFFQEDVDGNHMMGSPEISTILLKRMKMLLGVTYNELPTQSSGLLYSRIRDLYLNINENRLIEIKKNYPLYKYFLTEKTHFLSFPIIFENEQYVMYQIVKNE